MAIPLYDTTVRTFTKQLQNLSDILKKAEQWCDDNAKPHAELLEARLAPDMYPLPYQVRICTNMARNGVLVNDGTWKWLHPYAQKDDADFAGLQARIQKTLEWLGGIKEEDIEGGEKMPCELWYSGEDGKGVSTKFDTGHKLLLQIVLPQFWFHETTAYAICRMKGVPLGKRDFIVGSSSKLDWS